MNTAHDTLPPGAFRGAGYWVRQVASDIAHEAYLQSLVRLKAHVKARGLPMRQQWSLMADPTLRGGDCV